MKRFSSLLLLAVVAIPCPAQASPEMQEMMGRLAERVLATTKGDPVTVGVFSPTGLAGSTSGIGINAALTDELNRKKPGSVRADAKFEVKGDYAFAQTRDPLHGGLKVIKLTWKIFDKKFAEVVDSGDAPFILHHTRTIAEITQVSGPISPNGSKQKRNQELDKHRQRPKTFIHGPGDTLIASSAGKPYTVQISVKPFKDHKKHTAVARKATDEDGAAFVDIKRDELYEVTVFNHTNVVTAVALVVDGIDVFHFTQDRVFASKADKIGRPAYSHFILRPNSSRTIVGWHNTVKGDDNYLRFLVTEHGRGAVSKSGIRSGKVGVIQAQFAKCSPLPAGAKSRSGNETGFGPPEKVADKVLRYEIEPPHDFIAVRYDRIGD
ncbi:MAG: hypothetical protein O3A00_11210 [Planctomycetota bacterium]|nr:hypothetical protein [Planctomycetota bacterium]